VKFPIICFNLKRFINFKITYVFGKRFSAMIELTQPTPWAREDREIFLVSLFLFLSLSPPSLPFMIDN
jgi:hypothetical protein